jgi:hypothetical protein
MDFNGLVVRDGDLVTASGRLVRDQAGAFLAEQIADHTPPASPAEAG